MTKAEITICAYYGDLCVHNFSSGVSAQRSLIGRLQGPQREMTERALEEWEVAATPARPCRGGLRDSRGGGGGQLLNFLST